MSDNIKLSICIATFNRANFIGETIDSIVSQLNDEVELVIVNGCSPDHTDEVVKPYLSLHPQVRYFKEDINSGIDGDYNKAVQYAKGEYCWLMTDDDLAKPHAVDKILQRLQSSCDLLVLNAEITNVDFSKTLDDRLIKKTEDQTYTLANKDSFMAEMGHGLSFIGCVVINKQTWLTRNSAAYFGTFFVHVGVIFQRPLLKNIAYISEPLITIRYGNAMWTPRGLEIWLFKWPNLIWSFPDFSDDAKAAVCPPSHTRNLKTMQRLFFYRATGAYSYAQYKRFFAEATNSSIQKCLLLSIAMIPPTVANMLASLFCLVKRSNVKMPVYSLNGSQYANPVSRLVAKVIGV